MFRRAADRFPDNRISLCLVELFKSPLNDDEVGLRSAAVAFEIEAFESSFLVAIFLDYLIGVGEVVL